jgi:DNA polymerase I-like protein with 3'-5' exonuclease and polymerase domains
MKKVSTNTVCVNTWPKFMEMCAHLMAATRVAVDTETTGLDVFSQDFQLSGLCFATDTYRGFYVPVHHETGEQILDRDLVLRWLVPLLDSPTWSKKIIMHHAAFDLKVLSRYKIPVRNLLLDTLCGDHLLGEKESHKLKGEYGLIDRVLGFNPGDYKDHIGEGRISQVPLETATAYAANDARYTFCSYLWQRARLNQDTKLAALARLETRLTRVTQEMEETGFLLDQARMQGIQQAVYAELDELRGKMRALVQDEEYSGSSHAVLKKYLYDYWGLESKKPGKKRKNAQLTSDQKAIKTLLRSLQTARWTDRVWTEEVLVKDSDAAEEDFKETRGWQNAVSLERDDSRLLDRTKKEIPETSRAAKHHVWQVTKRITRDQIVEFLQVQSRFTKVDKLRSTYTDALVVRIRDDGRVHPSFQQSGTSSGRYSAAAPNLQNLAKNSDDNMAQYDIRSCLVADPDYCFVVADYTSMEMAYCAIESGCSALTGIITGSTKIRLSASQEPPAVVYVSQGSEQTRELKAAGKTVAVTATSPTGWLEYTVVGQRPDGSFDVQGADQQTLSVERSRLYVNIDIHKYTACQTPGMECDYHEVTPEQRQNSKITNFGILFGQTEMGLSEQLGIDLVTAKQFIGGFLLALPGVDRWMKKTEVEVRKNLRVSTLFGRQRRTGRRELEEDQGGEIRSLTNHKIQGGCADVTKMAMVKVQERLDAELPTRRRDRSVLIAGQIHDELILLAHKDHVPLAQRVLKEEMTTRLENTDVVLQVETGVQRTLSKIEKN